MLIADLQTSIVKRLTDDPYFSQGTPPIPVVSRASKNIMSFMGERFGAVALCVIVYPDKGRFVNMNVRHPNAEIGFWIEVIENPVVNESRRVICDDVFWAAARLFWLTTAVDANGVQLAASHWTLGDIESETAERQKVDLFIIKFHLKCTAADKEIITNTARSQ